MVIIVFAAVMLLTGCHRKEHAQPKPHWFKYYKSYHEKDYIHYIEEQTHTPISIVSVGPDRAATIFRS